VLMVTPNSGDERRCRSLLSEEDRKTVWSWDVGCRGEIVVSRRVSGETVVDARQRRVSSPGGRRESGILRRAAMKTCVSLGWTPAREALRARSRRP
jgi:L-asparaginase II